MTAPTLNNCPCPPAPETTLRPGHDLVHRLEANSPQQAGDACLGIIVFYACVALYAEGVYRYCKLTEKTPPYKVVNFENRFAAPSPRHPLGTDSLGRDVLLQVVQGTRIAFTVGILTSAIAIPIAVVLGAIGRVFRQTRGRFHRVAYTQCSIRCPGCCSSSPSPSSSAKDSSACASASG